MSGAKFTPGPWHRNIRPARHYPTIFAGRNNHVAVIHHHKAVPDEEAEANHDLITAAPQLYVMLEKAARTFAQYGQNHRDKGTAEGDVKGRANDELAFACFEVLAKARGEV